MADEIPAILHHVSVGTNDFDKASAFYDAVLTTVGARRVMEFPGVVAYGKAFPEFWVHGPLDGQPAAVGNGTHFCFIASSQEAVHAFYDAALAAGGVSDGEPGPRPDYGPDYYGAFVRDPDGHKIEAALAHE
jgi:catechol 2,3-dioxygenase-like lactoylglutathione lyase family enzyme